MDIEVSTRRMLATWAAVAGSLSQAARHHAKKSVDYPTTAGPSAIMLAEAAAYAFHQATGEGDWADRKELFRTPSDKEGGK